MIRPLLSVYSGADLLGRGFIRAGYSVVSAGDILTGHNIRHFHPARGAHEGVIGGPPCQGFSLANRLGVGYFGSLRGVYEFARVVKESDPLWFLMECTPTVPSIIPFLEKLDAGLFAVQRFNVNPREFGFPQNRLRCFQFGSRDGAGLVLDRNVTRIEREELGISSPRIVTGALPYSRENRAVLASEGRRKDRRTFADVCELQGLPRDFLCGSPLSQALKYQLVGNGSCPVPMAEIIATAIRRRHETRNIRVCICQCGRPVRDGVTMATAACRKRMERRRDAAVVERAGNVTREPCDAPDGVTTLVCHAAGQSRADWLLREKIANGPDAVPLPCLRVISQTAR